MINAIPYSAEPFSIPNPSTTIGITSGKFYWEFYATNTANAMGGITTSAASISNYIGSDALSTGR